MPWQAIRSQNRCFSNQVYINNDSISRPLKRQSQLRSNFEQEQTCYSEKIYFGTTTVLRKIYIHIIWLHQPFSSKILSETMKSFKPDWQKTLNRNRQVIPNRSIFARSCFQERVDINIWLKHSRNEHFHSHSSFISSTTQLCLAF